MKYRMKRVMIVLAAAGFSIGAVAQQTTQDGKKMYNFEKYQSAEHILAPLAATDAQANYYLGLTYLQEGNIAKASEAFAKYPEDPANISGTARVAFTNKDVAKGMEIAKALAAKSRKKEWIQEKYAADAITFTEGGDYHQAIVWYTDVNTKTDDADAHLGMGDAYRKIAGGGGDAMNNYEHVTDKDAKNSLAFTRIGDLWYQARNYQSALDNYAKAQAADSTNPLPYKALAKAYASSGKFKLALDYLQKYQKLSDNTQADKMEYLRALFLAHSNCDAATMAKQLYNDQLDMKAKTEIYGILGYAETECGDSLDALKNMRLYMLSKSMADIKPDNYLQFGKIFMKLGQLDSAGFYYQKGISGDTAQNKTDIYRQIADAYKAKKDYCMSADWYNNLVKANPETQPADYVWRGIMYFYCKDYTKAMSAFADFGAKYPDQPTALYWQGRTGSVIDSDGTQGTGVEFFNKWLDKVGPNYEKKNDLKGAYEYLLYYYFNKKDADKVKFFKEKIVAIDPNDSVLKSIEEVEKANNAPKKQPTAKPKK